MTTPVKYLCQRRNCKWYRMTNDTDDPICVAYPLGIPIEILDGTDLHMTPRGDDDGIFYQSNEVLKTFEGHKGIPGHQGGSLPKKSVDISAPTQKAFDDLLSTGEIPYDDEYTVKIGSDLYDVRLEGWFPDCMESRNIGETSIASVQDNYLDIMQAESGTQAHIHGYIPTYPNVEYGVSYIGTKIVEKTFEDHEGIPGHQGGSLPRNVTMPKPEPEPEKPPNFVGIRKGPFRRKIFSNGTRKLYGKKVSRGLYPLNMDANGYVEHVDYVLNDKLFGLDRTKPIPDNNVEAVAKIKAEVDAMSDAEKLDWYYKNKMRYFRSAAEDYKREREDADKHEAVVIDSMNKNLPVISNASSNDVDVMQYIVDSEWAMEAETTADNGEPPIGDPDFWGIEEFALQKYTGYKGSSEWVIRQKWSGPEDENYQYRFRRCPVCEGPTIEPDYDKAYNACSSCEVQYISEEEAEEWAEAAKKWVYDETLGRHVERKENQIVVTMRKNE